MESFKYREGNIYDRPNIILEHPIGVKLFKVITNSDIRASRVIYYKAKSTYNLSQLIMRCIIRYKVIARNFPLN